MKASGRRGGRVLKTVAIGSPAGLKAEVLDGALSRAITSDLVHWCDASFWSDCPSRRRGEFPAGSVVFCKIDEVMRFFERLRMTRRRIVLVTGEGDLPCDAWRQSYLPENVLQWFATNVTSEHTRVCAVPLGLGPPNDPVTLREEELVAGRVPPRERTGWLYVNFRAATNPAIREPVMRRFAALAREGGDWITVAGSKSRMDYLSEMSRHRFVLCPPGNGVDTHRMWEAMVAGVIPIVLRSVAMKPFEALPLLLVDSYDEVTRPLLCAAWERLQFDPEQQPLLHERYWQSKVREARDRVSAIPQLEWLQWFGESIRYSSGMLRRRLS